MQPLGHNFRSHSQRHPSKPAVIAHMSFQYLDCVPDHLWRAIYAAVPDLWRRSLRVASKRWQRVADANMQCITFSSENLNHIIHGLSFSKLGELSARFPNASIVRLAWDEDDGFPCDEIAALPDGSWPMVTNILNYYDSYDNHITPPLAAHFARLSPQLQQVNGETAPAWETLGHIQQHASRTNLYTAPNKTMTMVLWPHSV